MIAARRVSSRSLDRVQRWPCDAIGGNAMTIAVDVSGLSVAWWREPTKDQWLAWIAAWLGWMLDAFDFTIFLLIMTSIAKEFGVSVTAVAAVLTFTLWLRLVGAIGSGGPWCRAARPAPRGGWGRGPTRPRRGH